MCLTVRICDQNSNKYSGFEISRIETIEKIFPHGARVGTKFTIGEYDYIVDHVYIDGFYSSNMNRPTLDNESAKLGTHIWIGCKTSDPRIKEGNISEESESSIRNDLGLGLK